MNARDAHSLIEKLKALPPQRQAEVDDFVDFLRSRDDDRHFVTGKTQLHEHQMPKQR